MARRAAPPPTPATALDASANLPDNGETHVVLFVRQSPGVFHGFRLNPTAPLANAFRAIAIEFATSLQSQTLVAYSAGRTPSPHEIAHLAVDQVPELTDVLRQLQTPADLTLFDEGLPEAKALRFYVVSIRAGRTDWVHFFRSISIRSRLRRSKKLAVFLTGAAYDRLETDPFLFDTRFDAITSAGVLLLTHQRSFEMSLDFYDQAGPAVTATLNQITAKLRIRNPDDLVAAASTDPNMIAKVRSIAEKLQARPDYAKAMTMDKLVAFIGQRPDLQIDIEGDSGAEELVFHSDPRRRWRILKLLDDDFLRSLLTDIEYESNSKSFLP